jgi:ABC-type multidrug transport system permease subunit
MEEDDINVSPPEAATPPTSAHDPSSASEDTASSPKPRWVVTVAALLRKNILLLWSSKIALFLIIFFPTLGVGLTRIIDKATESSPGSSYDYNQDYIDQITAITMVDAGASFGKCQWFDVYGGQTKAPKTECVTLLFSADNYDNVDDINKIMASIAEEAGVAFSPMAPDSSSAAFPQLPFRQEIFGFSSLLNIGEFLAANPGRAGGVVVFRASDGNKLVVDTWYNITGFPPNYLGNNRPETVLQLRAALGRGLLKTTLGKTEVDVVIRSRKLVDSTYTDQSNGSVDTDDYYSYGSTSSLSVGAYLLGIILALSYMLSSVLLVSFISREKQEGLIGSLRVVGMTDTAYWTSWLIIGVTNVVSSSLLAMIMAYILEVPVLTDSDFITPWLLVIVSGICMYAFATITVGLVTQRRAVNGLQFVAIILILVSANFGTFSTATKNDTAGRALLALFPGFILQFVSQHIAFYPSLAGNNNNVTLTYTFATLFERVGDCNSTILDAEGRCEYVQRFDDAGCWRYSDCGIGGSVDSFYCAPDDCYYFQPPDAFLIVIMILQTFVYLSLTWYFFKVIPSGNGIHRKLSFLCSPRYWRRKLPSSDGSTGTDQQLSGEEKSIRVRGISKVFGAYKAIDDISLDMANGQVSDFSHDTVL